MNTSEVIDLAADLIQSVGWERGGSRNSSQPAVAQVHEDGYCLEGALAAARGDAVYLMGSRCPAYMAVREYLNNRAPWIWNDYEAESADHVIEVLRGAAAVERAKEALVEGTVDTREEVHA